MTNGKGRKASLRTSDFVDALPIPIDGNFDWKECRFALFDYTKKDGTVVATTCAARVTFVDEAAAEYVQHYSVGDPSRVLPSTDGHSIVLQGDNANLNKSSNFFVLMKALEDAGLPDDFLGDDIAALEGMVTHNIGVVEPKRVGLERPTAAEGGRTRVLPVPDEIVSMPGKRGGKGAAGRKAPPTEDLVPEAMTMLTELLGENPKGVARKDIASHAIKAKRAPVATLAFKLTEEQLVEAGFVVDDNGLITAIE